MKMSKRAESALLNTYRVIAANQPALHGLVQFAAQNPGLDARNYVTAHSHDADGWRAYRQEARAINQDWQHFKTALAIAAQEGVTDKEIIEAAPRAYSGRLTWISKDFLREKHGLNADYTPRWDYTPGQYFPTEYRKAACAVLEAATRAIRQSRPPTVANVETIAQLKALNEKNGGCWFGASEMRFFGTRIESGIIRGRFFITSEQRESDTPRKFSVRSFDAQGDVDTVGEFHAYGTKDEAIAAIPTEEPVAA